MRTRKLIKTWEFSEDNRSGLTFGSKTRLNPETHRLELIPDSSGRYPVDADLWVRTWTTNPDSVRAWVGFEAIVIRKLVDGVDVALYQYRLSDGSHDYYWNGVNWVQTTTQWSTEAEIAAHIGTFPATEKTIGVVINQQTLDPTVTPQVVGVKVLWESDIDFQEDIVYRSLLRKMRETVRPIADYPIKLTASGSSLDLDSYPLDTPFNIEGIDSVFDHTNDPEHLENLFSSYNPTTKVITLTESMDAGETAWVRFTYAPEVSLTTSRDFIEQAKVPGITVESVALEQAAERGPDDAVIDKQGSGWKLPGPLVGNLNLGLVLMTGAGVDLQRMADEVKSFFLANPMLRSVGLDEWYRLWVREGFEQSVTPNLEHLHTGRMRVTIVGVTYWLKEAVQVYSTKRLLIGGDMNAVVQF